VSNIDNDLCKDVSSAPSLNTTWYQVKFTAFPTTVPVKAMPISFDQLKKGSAYSRRELAEKWGYKGFEAISRGIVTPASSKLIVLFITAEKQKALPQYRDQLEGSALFMEGETNHTADNRIIAAASDGHQIHLLYRAKHHSAFTYEGQAYLVDYELHEDRPSLFAFTLDRLHVSVVSAIQTEARTHGAGPTSAVPEVEVNAVCKRV
jgi:hypothetical protein